MSDIKAQVQAALDEIRQSGLYKNERQITTPQRVRIGILGGQEVLLGRLRSTGDQRFPGGACVELVEAALCRAGQRLASSLDELLSGL